ncbi:LOW QUALITY PROTEIN: nicastrin-like [Pecten maximus]|uniref:LOW QUALITY PROTEIN: nicastrin-like n=1 Tax=Pecten maximus TaxID=6579 RepID=UPI00145889C6|nr:LOW QUALITY PROTEIN: nicastrin-like [Pecten maximus]
MAVTVRIAHVISWFFLFTVANCERVSNKTYVEINGVSACFRRFNATHQVGCTSKASGNVGVVYYVESINDINYIIKEANQPPYAILMGPELFTLKNVQNLWNSGKINGMMVIHLDTTPIPDTFSPDTTCPNDPYGLYHGNSDYGNCREGQWNLNGNSMMFHDYAFPIFVMKDEEEVNYLIHDCFESFNKPIDGNPRNYPLCAVELKDSMSGSKDSVTCIRRNNMQASLDPETYCDPLGDKNIVAPLKSVPSTEDYPDNSVIVAAARMDTFSMFENEYPGADSHVTGIVGLLAAAEAIGKVKESIIKGDNSKDILFAFFQGEAFDYIGSSRTVYDMEKDKFPQEPVSGETHVHPINLQHISHFVEVSQLGLRDDDKLWIHTDPISVKSSKKISEEVDVMIKNITDLARMVDLDIGNITTNKPLPPSSVQRFLKKRQIPAIVMTDHQGSFTNKYYNSRFDRASTIQANSTSYDMVTEQAQKLTKVATTLARSLFLLATDGNTTEVEANVTSVTHMLYCFLINKTCDLFQEIIDEDNLDTLLESSTPYPFYVGVTTTNNHVTSLTKRLLSLYLGDRKVNVTKDNCNTPDKDKVYEYTWMQGPLKTDQTREGVCIQSSVSLTSAKSPAFDITDYDWTSGEFSTWTESSWKQDAISIRVFLIPSEQMEVVLLCSGLALFVVSLAISYFINKKSSILFQTPQNLDPPTENSRI